MKIFLCIPLLIGLSITQTAFAIDIDNGMQLHEENCLRCHQPTLYSREKRMVNNLDQLHERVRLCELMLELMWFDEEINDVAAFLNKEYYKFNLEK